MLFASSGEKWGDRKANPPFGRAIWPLRINLSPNRELYWDFPDPCQLGNHQIDRRGKLAVVPVVRALSIYCVRSFVFVM